MRVTPGRRWATWRPGWDRSTRSPPFWGWRNTVTAPVMARTRTTSGVMSLSVSLRVISTSFAQVPSGLNSTTMAHSPSARRSSLPSRSNVIPDLSSPSWTNGGALSSPRLATSTNELAGATRNLPVSFWTPNA